MRRAPLAVLVAGLLLAGAVRAVDPGEMAPEVAGKHLLGEQRLRLSEWRGRLVIVDFWATWCGPCVLSMPQLDGLRSKLHAEGLQDRFEILGVNMDDDPARARKFLELRPVTYPVISDLIGLAARRYQPPKLPSAYLVGPDGRVRFIYYGHGEGYAETLEAKVRELLAEPPASVPSPASAAETAKPS